MAILLIVIYQRMDVYAGVGGFMGLQWITQTTSNTLEASLSRQDVMIVSYCRVAVLGGV